MSLVFNNCLLTSQTTRFSQGIHFPLMQKKILLHSVAPHTCHWLDLKWGRTCLVCAGDGSWCCLGAASSIFLPLKAAIPLKGRSKENLLRKSFSSVSVFIELPWDSPWPVPLCSFRLQVSPSSSFYSDSVPQCPGTLV